MAFAIVFFAPSMDAASVTSENGREAFGRFRFQRGAVLPCGRQANTRAGLSRWIAQAAPMPVDAPVMRTTPRFRGHGVVLCGLRLMCDIAAEDRGRRTAAGRSSNENRAR